MRETIHQRPVDAVLEHSETHSIERTNALAQVLRHFGLPFRVVANEGAPYPDGGRVPKGATFVTYDTGDIPADAIWRRVDQISPIPMLDGKR